MSNRYNEDNSFVVGSGACSYANFSHYNKGSNGMHPHVPKGTASGYYVVPTFDSIGYDSLTHKKYNNDSCCGSPYTNIRAAYNSHDGNCNQKYVHMQCNR